MTQFPVFDQRIWNKQIKRSKGIPKVRFEKVLRFIREILLFSSAPRTALPRLTWGSTECTTLDYRRMEENATSKRRTRRQGNFKGI